MGAFVASPATQDSDRSRGARTRVPAERSAGDHRSGGGLRELGGVEGLRRRRANAGAEQIGDSLDAIKTRRATSSSSPDVVGIAAEFFSGTLGFSIDFLHGHPPFYGAVSRDGACVHLKFVHEPVFAIDATVSVTDSSWPSSKWRISRRSMPNYLRSWRHVPAEAQEEAWGGRDFIVRDLDGNGISFLSS